MQTNTLRPGLLVSLKTSTRGGYSYRKETLTGDHVRPDDGKRIAEWKTERTIDDPAEYEAAGTARSKASSLIRSVCSNSAFGLLCPESDAEDLENAIREARTICDEFNLSAKLTRISVNVLIGRIAPDDVEAVKAINSEVRDLMRDMKEGLQNLDVKAVREAASKAKNIAAMLSPDAAARVQIAVDAARSCARRVTKAGETAASEIDRATLRRIEEARTAFLDLDEQGEIAAPAAQGRAVDLEPTAAIAAPKQKARAVEY